MPRRRNEGKPVLRVSDVHLRHRPRRRPLHQMIRRFRQRIGDVDSGPLRHLQPDRVEDAFCLALLGVHPRDELSSGDVARELHIMVHAQPQPHTGGNHDRGAAYKLARPLRTPAHRRRQPSPGGISRTVPLRRSLPAVLRMNLTFAGYAAGRVIDVAVIEDPAAGEAGIPRRTRPLVQPAEPRSAGREPEYIVTPYGEWFLIHAGRARINMLTRSSRRPWKPSVAGHGEGAEGQWPVGAGLFPALTGASVVQRTHATPER